MLPLAFYAAPNGEDPMFECNALHPGVSSTRHHWHRTCFETPALWVCKECQETIAECHTWCDTCAKKMIQQPAQEAAATVFLGFYRTGTLCPDMSEFLAAQLFANWRDDEWIPRQKTQAEDEEMPWPDDEFVVPDYDALLPDAPRKRGRFDSDEGLGYYSPSQPPHNNGGYGWN